MFLSRSRITNVDYMQTDQNVKVSGMVKRPSTSTKLLVAALSGINTDPVLALVQSAWSSSSSRSGEPLEVMDGQALGGLGQVATWLAEHPMAHGLLLFKAPVFEIAQALADGREPEAALSQWMAGVQPLFQVVRANRRRVTLVPLEAALAHPASLIDGLINRMGLNIPAASVPSACELPEVPSAMFRMLAENALWQSHEARHLAAELEASSLPIEVPDEWAETAVNAAYSDIVQRMKEGAAPSRELQEENELLLQQLHQVQEELETHFLSSQKYEKQVAELDQEKQKLSTRLDHARNELEGLRKEQQNNPRLTDLQEENDLLLQQLHHVQEELESYYLDNQKLRHDAETKQAQNEALQYTVDALHGSMSWKITAPLRFIMRPFMGK